MPGDTQPPALTTQQGYVQQLTFAGCPSFLRRPFTQNLNGVDLAITGIPFDCATTNRPGTRLGPRAVREQSSLQAHDAPYGWATDPFATKRIVDYGDCQFGIIGAGVAALSIGGDHYVTYPILKAHAAKYGPLSLLQFDAHSDTWEDDSTDRIDHGTMFRRAINDGVVLAEHSVQVGIRTTNPDTMGVNILDAPLVNAVSPVEVAKRVTDIIGNRPCYLTFDIDCLDPAYAPGTGVEVSPPYDHAGITAIAGAHIAVELACLWASCQQ